MSLFYKNQFNLLINVFEQHLLNSRHVCSWMLKLCMKTLQCATKVLLFCFEVKRKSNVILKSDIIQHGMLNGVMLKEETMSIKRKFLERRLWRFQRPGWLARLLENNIFRKRTSYCWHVYRNGYFLDEEEKRTDWGLLIGKHLEYGQIWLLF